MMNYTSKNVISKVIAREKIIQDSIEQVTEFVLGEPYSGYSVRSILISTRPTFYGYSQNKIDYYDLTGFFNYLEEIK